MSVLAIALPAMAAETAVGSVNVRSGPSTNYGRLGTEVPKVLLAPPSSKHMALLLVEVRALFGTMLIILDVLVVVLLVMPLLQDTFILLASAQLL